MKIISAKINHDGHYELLVEGERLQTYRDTILIANFDYAKQNNPELKDEEAYFEKALEECRKRLEEPPPAEPEKQKRAAALVGRIVEKGNIDG